MIEFLNVTPLLAISDSALGAFLIFPILGKIAAILILVAGNGNRHGRHR